MRVARVGILGKCLEGNSERNIGGKRLTWRPTEYLGSGVYGLAVLAFRDGTPYQGEDLIYDADFFVRCTRNRGGSMPGVCLYERRIHKADVIVRFPRVLLDDWRPGCEPYRSADREPAALAPP